MKDNLKNESGISQQLLIISDLSVPQNRSSIAATELTCAKIFVQQSEAKFQILLHITTTMLLA